MIEVMLKEYLDDALPYPVLLEKPSNPPDGYEFILLERTGDLQHDVCIRDATIAAQTYGESLYRAAQMAEELVDALEGAVIVDKIASVEINSMYNFTDRLTKEYRYQVVINITYYKGD